MSKKAFDSIMAGLQVGLSQEEFARAFGVSVGTSETGSRSACVRTDLHPFFAAAGRRCSR